MTRFNAIVAGLLTAMASSLATVIALDMSAIDHVMVVSQQRKEAVVQFKRVPGLSMMVYENRGDKQLLCLPNSQPETCFRAEQGFNPSVAGDQAVKLVADWR